MTIACFVCYGLEMLDICSSRSKMMVLPGKENR